MFYRQFYRPPIGEVASSSPAAKNGVWMVGAEVGLHYNTAGALEWAFGTQFEDVAATSTPIIGSAADAVQSTDEALVDRQFFSASDLGARPQELVDRQLSKAELLLHSTGEGDSFDYVWQLPTGSRSTLSLVAMVDAETRGLLSVTDGIAWDECTPNSPDQDSALGVTQNGAVINRNIWATETDDRGESYTHEARKVGSGSFPDIQIFMPMDDDGCDNEDYALMPVKTVSGSVRYDDYETPDEVDGRIAADALFFTYKTMSTFDDLGRDGWDDNNGEAIVVFDADCRDAYDRPIRNTAGMIYDCTVDYAPDPSLAVCLLGTGAPSFTEAAAIDVIAHEWGHGVIFTENLWDRVDEGAIYHEAWADVVGHIVEWDNQVPGSTVEKADWEFGEDRGTTWRTVNVDDNTGPFAYHDDDTQGTATSIYHSSLPLSVAFYLMADGDGPYSSYYDHKNPWCATNMNNDDCDVTVIDIGITKTSEMFFYALTNLAGSNTDWEDFGDIVQYAAFLLYGNCPSSSALTEQLSAYAAFTAIGYEPGGEFFMTCQY